MASFASYTVNSLRHVLIGAKLDADFKEVIHNSGESIYSSLVGTSVTQTL